MLAVTLIGSLLALSPLAAPQSQAPAWRQSSGGTAAAAGAAAYIDTNSIQRSGDIATFWREIRFPAPRTLSDGTSFDRILARIEIHCTALTIRTLELRGKLGDAVVVTDDKPEDAADAIKPNSTAMDDLNAACHNKWLSGAK